MQPGVGQERPQTPPREHDPCEGCAKFCQWAPAQGLGFGGLKTVFLAPEEESGGMRREEEVAGAGGRTQGAVELSCVSALKIPLKVLRF